MKSQANGKIDLIVFAIYDNLLINFIFFKQNAIHNMVFIISLSFVKWLRKLIKKKI
jgi:hypothetical protein